MNDQTIVDKVLKRIERDWKGEAFTPKDFLDLASHETVRQILTRSTMSGKIRRIHRGIYDYPAFSSLLNAPSSPDPDSISRAIARAHGWSIVPTGETALNLLGLSTQIPAQLQYFSDGPAKTFKWSGGKIVFKHRTNKETTRLSPKTALVVQALKAMDKQRVDDKVIKKLRARLDAKELKLALKEAQFATSWVYEVIKRIAAEKRSANV